MLLSENLFFSRRKRVPSATNCNQHQIEEMLKRFYTGDADEFANKVLLFGKNVSPAQIQGYFMVHKMSSSADVIRNAGQIWDDSRKSEPQKVVAEKL